MKSAKETKPAKDAKSHVTPAQPAAPMKGWQRWMPWAITFVFAAWVISALRPPADKSAFNATQFGKLPVVWEGRVQPFDSVARNTLLLMRSKQTLALEKEATMGDMSKAAGVKKMSATEWLLELMTRPENADKRKVFRIDHPELKSLLSLPIEEKHFSLDQIRPGGAALMKEAQRISGIESQLQTPFEKSVVRLAQSLMTYQRFKSALQPEGAENFTEEVALFERGIKPGLEALRKREAGESYAEEDLALLGRAFRRFEDLQQVGHPDGRTALLPLIIPPADPTQKEGWSNMGATLKEAMREGTVPASVKAYAAMSTAYAKNDPATFNKAVTEYDQTLRNAYAAVAAHGRNEWRFNQYQLFIKAMSIYLAAFLFACVYWLRWSPWLRTTGARLAVLALIVHSVALIYRMYLQGRPPVTNLYSSAIFVGWGAPILGLIIEKFFKDGIGIVSASMVGFISLVIAHNLSNDGTDTMKLLQAVLDTNIWLATHVVVITLGYASMFLAGTLATIYIVRGVFTSNFSATTGRNLTRMVYGIACFATLFSFVGTVLGGIWADQSWGRFWGWDVKENGALLIVIWCAVILHARWGGLVRERGLMAMAVFGNIVTAFSWFGVNMLGVGLHSYGFMEEAFKWLVAFCVSQVVLIGLAMLPTSCWKSPPGGGGAKSTAKVKEMDAAGSEQLAAAQKMLPQNPAN